MQVVILLQDGDAGSDCGDNDDDGGDDDDGGGDGGGGDDDGGGDVELIPDEESVNQIGKLE